MLFLLTACVPTEPPPTVDVRTIEPMPEGTFEVAFDFPYRVNGSPWEVFPAGTVTRTGDALHVELRETWKEQTPFFPHCPIQLALDGSTSDGTLVYDTTASGVDDPCVIEPYADGDPFVVRFVARDTAFGWLAEALSMNGNVLEGGQDVLEADLGPATDWFAFWGPSREQLWPLGHVFHPSD